MSLNDKLWNWLDKNAEGDFTTDLSLCFKWLVPKAIDYLTSNDLSTVREAYYKLIGLWLVEPNPPSALALCLAIEKLIDGGDNGS